MQPEIETEGILDEGTKREQMDMDSVRVCAYAGVYAMRCCMHRRAGAMRICLCAGMMRYADMHERAIHYANMHERAGMRYAAGEACKTGKMGLRGLKIGV